MLKSIKICIDDKCYESYMHIIEGEKIADDVRATIVECMKQRLTRARNYYKGKNLTTDKESSKFTKKLTRKTSKSHVRTSSRTKVPKK